MSKNNFFAQQFKAIGDKIKLEHKKQQAQDNSRLSTNSTSTSDVTKVKPELTWEQLRKMTNTKAFTKQNIGQASYQNSNHSPVNINSFNSANVIKANSSGQEYRRKSLEQVTPTLNHDTISDDYQPRVPDANKEYVIACEFEQRQQYLITLNSRDEADLFVDLHGETKNTSKIILLDAIKHMRSNNYISLEIITGIGSQTLKNFVAEFLVKHPEVAAYKLRFTKDKKPRGYKTILK